MKEKKRLPYVVTYDPGPPPGPILRALAEHIAMELPVSCDNDALVARAIRLAHRAESLTSRYVTNNSRSPEELDCLRDMVAAIDQDAQLYGLRFVYGPSQGYYWYHRPGE